MPMEYSDARRFVEHEDNLINHRFSWLILAQSFLLASWFNSSDPNPTKEFVLALAGLASCVFPYISVCAAVKSLEDARKAGFTEENKKNYPLLTSPPLRHWLGLLGAVITPIAFIFVWVWILWPHL